MKQFKDHYKNAPSPSAARSALRAASPGGRGGKAKAAPITKQDIFHYVYAVLHDPVYREKYAQNLKREFPRIPFFPDFWQWAVWGEALMALHILAWGWHLFTQVSLKPVRKRSSARRSSLHR